MKTSVGAMLLSTLLVITFPFSLPTQQSNLATATPRAEQDPVLVGAGDIAVCNSSGDEATAALLDQIEGTVFTAGDNVYENGSPQNFRNCYEPSWGRHKARTYPVLGNHDFSWKQGQGYFDYFGAKVGEVGKGYYSFDLSDLHILMLYSNINVDDVSAQVKWMRTDLATSNALSTMAIWHHPRFSSRI